MNRFKFYHEKVHCVESTKWAAIFTSVTPKNQNMNRYPYIFVDNKID